MEQQFTESESIYLSDKLASYVDELVEQTMDLIAGVEASANSEFASQGLVFVEHSPANADFLTVALMEALFHKLHQGDPAAAELMLTMMAKQTGIGLHVDACG
ncbi:hypothetical protein [Pseudomonas sp. O39]|jgi:hypothetical protein|uniref:hypothetical protein n=1 Tax=unclassified Pseudomonas TaxID=196821 RepID=UPI00387A8C1E